MCVCLTMPSSVCFLAFSSRDLVWQQSLKQNVCVIPLVEGWGCDSVAQLCLGHIPGQKFSGLHGNRWEIEPQEGHVQTESTALCKLSLFLSESPEPRVPCPMSLEYRGQSVPVLYQQTQSPHTLHALKCHLAMYLSPQVLGEYP